MNDQKYDIMAPLSPYEKGENLPTAFLAENPEAFGLVSDVYPVALKTLLIAADGQTDRRGMIPPTYVFPSSDINELFEKLLGGILRNNDENHDLVARTLTAGENGYEHLVSRYAAVVAQAVALRVMREKPPSLQLSGGYADYYSRRLGQEIPTALAALRACMNNLGGLTAGAAAYFSSALAICRIDNTEGDNFVINMFGAGDFRFYLLDSDGLKLLWDEDLPLLSADDTVVTDDRRVAHKAVVVDKSKPFAVIVLSDGAYESKDSSDDRRILQKGASAALAWRDRMRLEESILRVISSTVREDQFSQKAEQYFSGHIIGDDSASGAMTLVGCSFEKLCNDCRTRLTSLEATITLLPNGYDTDNPPYQPDFDDVESDFLDDLFKKYGELRNISARILSARLQTMLNEMSDGDTAASEDEVVPRDYLARVYRSFDCENDDDRAQLEKNSKLLVQLISENWITLRPILTEAGREEGTHESNAMRRARESNDNMYRDCLELNSTLGSIRAERRALLSELCKKLENIFDILDTEERNIIYDRVGTDTLDLWFNSLSSDIPRLAASLKDSLDASAERSRSMFAAYSAQRYALFEADISAELAPYYGAIMKGTAGAGHWAEMFMLCNGIDDSGTRTDVSKLLSMLKVISESSGEISDRIEARAAETRTVRRLSSDHAWTKKALRATLHDLPGWEDGEGMRIGDSVRIEYRAMVRRWKENGALIAKQIAAFDAYYKVYTALSDK